MNPRLPSPWILASASPARRSLARLLGAPFSAERSGAPEPRRGSPRERALGAARRKARAVARRFPGRAVLACDTLVELDGEVFGKPRSWKEAERMLSRLSGRTHRIVTALWGVSPEGREIRSVETTRVTFHRLEPDRLLPLAREMGSLDKSGGYAIQRSPTERGPVLRLRGSYTNVIGLPLPAAARMLESLGVDVKPDRGVEALDRRLNKNEGKSATRRGAARSRSGRRNAGGP